MSSGITGISVESLDRLVIIVRYDYLFKLMAPRITDANANGLNSSWFHPGGQNESRRWDVILALNGPMASLGTSVSRSRCAAGVNPGPTGFALSGYRGVDVHYVITIYGEATAAPVGSNQAVPHVDWSNIDPIRGPEFINKGRATPWASGSRMYH